VDEQAGAGKTINSRPEMGILEDSRIAWWKLQQVEQDGKSVTKGLNGTKVMLTIGILSQSFKF
jgi:hypothetical protein